MENQQPLPPSSIDPTPVEQINVSQTNPNPISPILRAVLVSAAVFGIGGYYLGKQVYLVQNQTYITPTALNNINPTSAAVSTTPDPTANWKSAQFGSVQFKYPNDWTLDTSNPEFTNIRPPTLKTGEEYPAISIHANDNPNNLSVKDYDDFISSEGQDPQLYSALDPTTRIAQEKKVGTITGYQIENKNCEPLGCDSFAFSYNQKIYVINNIFDHSELPATELEKAQLKNTFNQIISTLKTVN